MKNKKVLIIMLTILLTVSCICSCLNPEKWQKSDVETEVAGNPLFEGHENEEFSILVLNEKQGYDVVKILSEKEKNVIIDAFKHWDASKHEAGHCAVDRIPNVYIKIGDSHLIGGFFIENNGTFLAEGNGEITSDGKYYCYGMIDEKQYFIPEGILWYLNDN
ncbi:MAG: hypothetical protein IJL87_08485, partial [Clostridia bacterium]|nr:hypothetical protein [Clostridia bacterium]